MRVLGIDPSMANTCVVVCDIKGGEILPLCYNLTSTTKGTNKQVRASSDTINRCREIDQEVRRMISTYKPQLIFVETPSGSQNSSGMKGYGIVCMLIASLRPIPIEVTPHEVKMASVGTKTASKREMIDWACGLYPDLGWLMRGGRIQNNMEHLADALAVIHAGMKTPHYNQLTALLEGNIGTL